MVELDISSIRNEYTKQELSRDNASENPIEQFKSWFQDAINAHVNEPTAMNLATASQDGKPQSRIVLLKDVSENGYTFFTNYKSAKGAHLLNNPYAALNFFWPELERQIRIEGHVSRTSKETSEEYFQSRPFGSQIGAIASEQSTEIENRQILEALKEKLTAKYEGQRVPRPAHWGGYCLAPNYIEFWQGRASRLHDRICYKKTGPNDWKISRLAP